LLHRLLLRELRLARGLGLARGFSLLRELRLTRGLGLLLAQLLGLARALLLFLALALGDQIDLMLHLGLLLLEPRARAHLGGGQTLDAILLVVHRDLVLALHLGVARRELLGRALSRARHAVLAQAHVGDEATD